MLIATWLALPAIVVGLLRGAAAGRQLWTAMAIERSVNSVFRLCVLGTLALLGKLDVTSAVLVMCIAPIVGGLAYVGLIFRPAPTAVRAGLPPSRGLVPDLLGFGLQVWLGSVAIELMGRLDQLLVTPLAGVEQLGLLIVATNVSDVPYIVSQTIREVAFGASSADADLERLLATSRIATMLAAASAVVLGGTFPCGSATSSGRASPRPSCPPGCYWRPRVLRFRASSRVRDSTRHAGPRFARSLSRSPCSSTSSACCCSPPGSAPWARPLRRCWARRRPPSSSRRRLPGYSAPRVTSSSWCAAKDLTLLRTFALALVKGRRKAREALR